MEMQRKSIVAVLLILLWAGLAVWQWGLPEEPARVPLTNVTGHAASGRQADGGGTSLYVNLDLLRAAGIRNEATFMRPRNVFAVPNPQGSLTSTPDSVVNQSGPASAETVAEQMDAEASGQFQYLGFLRLGEGRGKNKNMAVLRKNDEVLVLKVGDRIDDHLVLKAISSESVILRNSGTQRERTVLLSEDQTVPE